MTYKQSAKLFPRLLRCEIADLRERSAARKSAQSVLSGSTPPKELLIAMETPRTPAGKLTDHIMAAMPKVDNYNDVYTAVLGALNDADSVGLSIVPDNDHALMAVITNWPVAKRKRFYRIVNLVCD